MAKSVSLFLFFDVVSLILNRREGMGTYKGRPMLRTPVSVRACVGVGKVTVPNEKDET